MCIAYRYYKKNKGTIFIRKKYITRYNMNHNNMWFIENCMENMWKI